MPVTSNDTPKRQTADFKSLPLFAKRTAGKWLNSILAKRNKKIVPIDFCSMREIHNLGREYHLDIYANEYTNDFIRMSLLDLAIDEKKTKK